MFSLYSTEDVLAETVRALRKKNKFWDGGQITRLRDSIVENLDVMVDDFAGNVSFPGEDLDDTHVHAAAMGCGADMLLTLDTGFLDLPEAVTDELEYEVFAPDDFFILFDDSSPASTLAVLREQISYFNEKKQEPKILHHLRANQCPDFALRIQKHMASLAGNRAVRRHATIPIPVFPAPGH